jgi:hypothetical protein
MTLQQQFAIPPKFVPHRKTAPAASAAALLSDLLRVSPPPNDRGVGATQFLSVADPREHCWLVAAQLDATSLQGVAITIGLRAERFVSDGADAALITGPAPWKSVQRLIAALDLIDAAPCVARYESCREVEAIQ